MKSDSLRRTIVLFAGIVLSLAGLYLVHDFGGWQLLIAIFILTWGNNIQYEVRGSRA